MQFFTYPKDRLPDLTGYVLLTLDAPPLTCKDVPLGLFLIDGTWRHAQTMVRQLALPHAFSCRSIPSTYITAYPRRQEDCSDPHRGLASVEALYIAYCLLDRPACGLLDGYYWKNAFLEKNAHRFAPFRGQEIEPPI